MYQKIKRKFFLLKKINTDFFINRLRASVIGEGMLHDGNIFLIDYAIKNMPNKGVVFEIGSYGGLSTNVILHLLKKHNKNNKMIGCDAWVYEGYKDYTGTMETFMDGRKDILRIDYMQYIKKSFLNACKLLHPNNLPYTYHLKSDEFFNKWNNDLELTDVFNRKFNLTDKITFAYIDGNHSYEQTKRDFENVAKYLNVNGFVLIDDSADYMKFGSVKYTKEILKMSNFKLVKKNPNYLFQKIKK